MNDELVQVLVPRRYLTDVYGFIAELEARTRVTADTEAADSREWTPDLVQRAYSESPKSMKRVLWLMAHHSNETLSTDDLAAVLKTGATWNNVAGALGAFGRRVRSRYAMTSPPYET